MPSAYSRSQILLHWIVALLVLLPTDPPSAVSAVTRGRSHGRWRHHVPPRSAITGRLAGRGLASDGLGDEVYVVLDGAL